jgi:chemotaxis protein methyltransferase CheR
MPSLELSPTVFSILTGLIEQRAGLHYDLLDRDFLREKVSARVIEAGFESFLDYYYFLRYDSAGEQELAELIEALVVSETYFFREWAAIRVLVSSFVEPACKAGRRPRIWSAACASGEEPLSLAMLLDSCGFLDEVEIVATDISTRALAKAKQGKFGKRSVRQVPQPELLERYIRSEDDGFMISPRLIQAVQWQKRNLLDERDFVPLGKFDVILCRNVLIYFSDESIRRVLDRLWQALLPGGVLIVGVSESLMRFGSTFAGEEQGGVFVYRKAAQL